MCGLGKVCGLGRRYRQHAELFRNCGARRSNITLFSFVSILMADFDASILEQVVQVCKEGVGEAAEALGRALDAKMTMSVGESGTFDLAKAPDGFDGPGLVIVLNVGSAAAVVVLPGSSGMAPDWCAAPDPTGQSKLTTLAQELGMILLPEDFMPEDFKTGVVKNITGALGRGAIAKDAALVCLELTGEDGKTAVASLIWPAARPNSILGTAAAKPAAKPKAKAKPKPAPTIPRPARPSASPSPARRAPTRAEDLPLYTRSLLRIEVPVIVTLARKRERLSGVMEMGPGSIIHFDKSCEEMLDLEVGDRHVATGEAVKVGDKFGLRINSIVLPEERFSPQSKATVS